MEYEDARGLGPGSGAWSASGHRCCRCDNLASPLRPAQPAAAAAGPPCCSSWLSDSAWGGGRARDRHLTLAQRRWRAGWPGCVAGACWTAALLHGTPCAGGSQKTLHALSRHPEGGGYAHTRSHTRLHTRRNHLPCASAAPPPPCTRTAALHVVSPARTPPPSGGSFTSLSKLKAALKSDGYQLHSEILTQVCPCTPLPACDLFSCMRACNACTNAPYISLYNKSTQVYELPRRLADFARKGARRFDTRCCILRYCDAI